MAVEEKKPKIDLKARLGKAPTGATPMIPAAGRSSAPAAVPPQPFGSAPPAALGAAVVGRASVPAPYGSAPGVGGSVPAPPFAAPKQVTDPFGAPVVGVTVAAPAQATIKIEMDDEVVRAAAKGGKKAAMLGCITLVVGLGLGYLFGQRISESGQAAIAINGAKELDSDISASQVKIKEFSDKIGAAIKDLTDKKFPENFSTDLGGISFPFSADKLYGKGVGRFNDRVLKLLFSYTQDVESLNDRKDALKNLFSGQKKAITDSIAAGANPKVSWAVFVQKSPAHGPLAILAPLAPADAFAYKDANWPSKFKISNGREFVDTSRYEKGDPVSADAKVVTLPLDPDSVTSSFPNDILVRIKSELLKTDSVLNGQAGEEDATGILKKGELLLTELRKIGKK